MNGEFRIADSGLRIGEFEVVVDTISEAAVRLLEQQGFENFNTDGIAAVVQAVEQANAQSSFEDLTLDAAVTQAEQMAAADPVVQLVLQENQFTRTPTATVTPIPCTGDCNRDREVTINELLTMVNVALDSADVSACLAGDAKDSAITIDEILSAVNSTLTGCPPPPTPTRNPTVPATAKDQTAWC